MIRYLFLLLLFANYFAAAQEREKNFSLETNNAWFINAGRQALLSGHYEKELQLSKISVLAGHAGLGGIPGNHDTIYSGVRGYFTIFTGAALLVGAKSFYLEVGLDPQFYFSGGTSFCNLDGNFGIRYQPFRRGSLFCQLSYTPILYSTYNNDFDIPFSFSIGDCF